MSESEYKGIMLAFLVLRPAARLTFFSPIYSDIVMHLIVEFASILFSADCSIAVKSDLRIKFDKPFALPLNSLVKISTW